MAIHKRYKIESPLEADDRWCIEIEDHDRLGEGERLALVELTVRANDLRDELAVWLDLEDVRELVEVLGTVLGPT